MRQKGGCARVAKRGGVSRPAERRRRLVRPASAVHPAGFGRGSERLSSAGVGASQQRISRARMASIYGGLRGASGGSHQRIIGGLRGALSSASAGVKGALIPFLRAWGREGEREGGG